MTRSLTAEHGTARLKSAHSRVNGAENPLCGLLALAGFKAALRLIDDVNAAFPAYDPVVAVPTAKRFQ
jgi:hypothetical protein